MLNQGHQKTVGNKDQTTDPGKKTNKRKDKLSHGKLNIATDDYDAWFWKIIALCTHTKMQDPYLKAAIANHCKTEQDKNAKRWPEAFIIRTA